MVEFGAMATIKISIHALREEGDLILPVFGSGKLYFYPRPPRGGRHGTTDYIQQPDDFYPRPPRGGRRLNDDELAYCSYISIHALREEGDTAFFCTDPRIG